LTAHKTAIAYDVSTLSPVAMLAHARLSCAHNLSNYPVHTLAHTLQGSILPNYGAAPTPLGSIVPSNGLAANSTIENA